MNQDRKTCPCCTDQIGWIWNVEADTAEPCPECGGAGEFDVFIGSSAWDSHGAEPVYVTEKCETCNGAGEVTA